MKNIALFASGEGTNAQNIIDYFKLSDTVKVKLVVSNNPSANVLSRAKKEDVDSVIINRNTFYESDQIITTLNVAHIDLIVLAGFLWKIPESLIKAFPNKIINIHPALLPKYGGKGMYGIKVHDAVVAAKEKQSGITIHYVNEQYDEGKIISQHVCVIEKFDTVEDVAKKIHELEKEFFPSEIEKIVLSF
jgi:phosphoribosylglycinamide formyltransferase-1